MCMSSRLAAVIMALTAASGAAAESLGSLADYARVAGEVGAGRLNCGFDYDQKALQALGAPFQIGPADMAGQDKAAELVAGAMAEALARQAAAPEAECARLMRDYGPAGHRHPGLLRPRRD